MRSKKEIDVAIVIFKALKMGSESELSSGEFLPKLTVNVCCDAVLECLEWVARNRDTVVGVRLPDGEEVNNDDHN